MSSFKAFINYGSPFSIVENSLFDLSILLCDKANKFLI
ncbi:hypothetical protein T11_17822 [Trichinella zimbabwensis]|uniref:Uncharacterized protein n=1 Tax=Trichinella zimbabwensis TaxID=268475 RepID=A0A0V1GGQ9_9BILA|nr:hypothetical protein T11_17822 [Trichinella zimbabwensis]